MGWAARARAVEPKLLLWEWGILVTRIRARNRFERDRTEFVGHAIAVKYGSIVWHFRVEDYPGLG